MAIDMTREKIKQVLGYGQRTNKFYITFPAPFNGSEDDITYTVMSSSIPGKNIGEVVINFMGLQYFIPGDPNFNTWTVTFRNPTKHAPRKAMELWMASVVETQTNARGALTDVMKIPELKLLDENGEVTATFQLIECFPTSIGDESIDYEANDTISTFDMTFRFSDMLYNYE